MNIVSSCRYTESSQTELIIIIFIQGTIEVPSDHLKFIDICRYISWKDCCMSKLYCPEKELRMIGCVKIVFNDHLASSNVASCLPKTIHRSTVRLTI